MTIGERLRDLRKEKRKTLREVGIETGIDYSGLAQIERGERNCNTTTFDILAKYYNVSADYLLGKTDNPNAIVMQVLDNDGSITEVEYTLIDKLKGLTIEDMVKVDEYVDFLKSKNKGDNKQ